MLFSREIMIRPDNLDLIRTIFIVIGVTVALITFRAGQRQRKLENSLKLLDLFKDNLEKDDIKNWKNIFQASSEPSGAWEGSFLSEGKYQTPLNSLFSEGPEDHGSTARITQQIDLICFEILQNTIELRIIYSNIGQLMTVIYRWYEKEAFLKDNYPYFVKVMKKRTLNGLPRKTIAYCE